MNVSSNTPTNNIGQTLQKLANLKKMGTSPLVRASSGNQQKPADPDLMPITKTLGKKKALFSIKG